MSGCLCMVPVLVMLTFCPMLSTFVQLMLLSKSYCSCDYIIHRTQTHTRNHRLRSVHVAPPSDLAVFGLSDSPARVDSAAPTPFLSHSTRVGSEPSPVPTHSQTDRCACVRVCPMPVLPD